jgi:hypothetical protein
MYVVITARLDQHSIARECADHDTERREHGKSASEPRRRHAGNAKAEQDGNAARR